MTQFIELRRLRAKRGFGAKKAELVEEFRELQGDQTHYIIMTNGGTMVEAFPEQCAKLKETYIRLAAIETTIRMICHP